MLTIFTFPWQIQTVLYKSGQQIYADQNVFNWIILNQTDVFITVILLLFAILIYKKPSLLKFDFRVLSVIWLLLISFMILGIFFASDSILSLFGIIRFIQYGLFALVIASGMLDFKTLKLSLIVTVIFQGLIAITQFINNSSVGLEIIGEPILNIDFANVAKIDIAELKQLRAYGTFAHPNILATFLIFTAALLLHNPRRNDWIVIGFISVLLILTFSRAAWLVFVALIIDYFLRTKQKIDWLLLIGIAFVLLFILFIFRLDQLIIARIINLDWSGLEFRGSQYAAFIELFLNNIWTGVGLNNYVLNLSGFEAWQNQPLHNIYLLAFAELGLLGAVAYLIWWGTLLKNAWKVNLLSLLGSLAILGLFDHHLYTLPQGLIILMIAIGILIGKKLTVAA